MPQLTPEIITAERRFADAKTAAEATKQAKIKAAHALPMPEHDAAIKRAERLSLGPGASGERDRVD